MLTLRQADSIVYNTLLIFKGFEIERRKEGTNIFYKVHDCHESGKRFLGTYRVWEWHDGSGRSGWMPLDTNDSEVTRIRHAVWEAIMAIAVPANASTEHDAMQPTRISPDAGQDVLQSKRKKDSGNINVGKNVEGSAIINGNNNTVMINSSVRKKRKS